MNAKKWFLMAFALNTALLMWFALNENPDTLLFYVSKYISMPLFIAYVALVWPHHAPFKRLVFTGLLFYWGGEILLTLVARNPLFFTAGLGSFLVGHWFFIVSFFKLRSNHDKRLHPLWLIVPPAYALALLTYLNSGHLGAMLPFVAAYALTLTVLMLAAMLRYGKTNLSSFAWGLAGALIFIVSDSMIGINRFHHPLPHAELLIVTTYIAAFICMVRSCLLHHNTLEKYRERKT